MEVDLEKAKGKIGKHIRQSPWSTLLPEPTLAKNGKNGRSWPIAKRSWRQKAMQLLWSESQFATDVGHDTLSQSYSCQRRCAGCIISCSWVDFSRNPAHDLNWSFSPAPFEIFAESFWTGNACSFTGCFDAPPWKGYGCRWYKLLHITLCHNWWPLCNTYLLGEMTSSTSIYGVTLVYVFSPFQLH